jgi:hypothetical protein
LNSGSRDQEARTCHAMSCVRYAWPVKGSVQWSAGKPKREGKGLATFSHFAIQSESRMTVQILSEHRFECPDDVHRMARDCVSMLMRRGGWRNQPEGGVSPRMKININPILHEIFPVAIVHLVTSVFRPRGYGGATAAGLFAECSE